MHHLGSVSRTESLLSYSIFVRPTKRGGRLNCEGHQTTKSSFRTGAIMCQATGKIHWPC